ncbi:Mediator of RNA polymerase II transcription subunit 6 [Aphelenchoides fujianensis]|nr:Mediator of RNA polymerase II transcription subunit 6 [Aphelenchoides fujianensis]
MNNMNMPMGQPNVGMNMAGRLGPPQFQQQPEQNTLHVTYQDPAWPPNQINEHNRTSDNEQLRMQANLIQGGAQEMEANLQRMTGIQYVLHKSRPPLFVIRKQKRNGPFQVQPLCYYYVLNGIVYQAPDLYSVVNSRLIGAVEPLKTALSSVVDMLQLNSTKGTYSWKFTEPTKRSKKAAEEADTSTEAWNSRPPPTSTAGRACCCGFCRTKCKRANAENAASSDPVQQ